MPVAVVRPARLPSVQFWSLVVVRVAPSSGSLAAAPPPLGVNVNCKSWSVKFSTGSLNVMAIELTGVAVGDGGEVIAAVGGEPVSRVVATLNWLDPSATSPDTAAVIVPVAGEVGEPETV